MEDPLRLHHTRAQAPALPGCLSDACKNLESPWHDTRQLPPWPLLCCQITKAVKSPRLMELTIQAQAVKVLATPQQRR